MAIEAKRRTQNITGNLYVDSTCIDCDTCRWMAPEVFCQVDGQSAVYHQPIGEIEHQKALQALLSCPTSSIGTVERPQYIKTVHQTFPLAIADNVSHCGYHAEASYAAASYFIQHRDGNVLVDSPRFAPPLVKQIEAMGGIRWLYLTHKDDVADHQKYHEHFKCDRIIHQDDISEKLKEIEIKLTGTDVINLTNDALIIPVPGHTKGHTVLLYKNKFLFTGDHLCWSRHLEQLIGFKNFCWYSWPELIKSMEKLTQYDFEWVLPGHGRRYHADIETMHKELAKCLTWMKNQ